jgi:hypothetical protein
MRNGAWRLLECAPAWDGNGTWDCFIAAFWDDEDGQRRLVAVNYAGNQSQCYVRLPVPALAGQTLVFKDLFGTARYVRDKNDLAARGLYLDLAPWAFHVFEITHEE